MIKVSNKDTRFWKYKQNTVGLYELYGFDRISITPILLYLNHSASQLLWYHPMYLSDPKTLHVLLMDHVLINRMLCNWIESDSV